MIQLTITYDGNTINLQANGYRVDGFTPQTAADESTNVSERFDVLVTSQAQLYALEAAFAWARKHQSEGNAAWLNYAIDETTATQKAMIVNGAVLHDVQLSKRWRFGWLKAAVAIERKPDWRGVLTAISLSNPSGSGTSGVTVKNHWDGGTNDINYVQIAAASIGGDIPSPLKLQITNNFNNATETSFIWVGHNVESDPANFTPVLEAEDSTAGGTTTTPSATSSNNAYRTNSLATDVDTILFKWALSATLLGRAKSKYFKILGRFVTQTVYLKDVWFHPDVYYGVTALWEGPTTRPSSLVSRTIRDLGVVQLPPWLADVSSPDALEMRLYGRRAISSAINVALDYLYLLPVESWREFSVKDGVVYQSAIVDDGTLHQLYTQNATATARRGDVVGYGQAIMAIPNKLQRLYFLQHADTADDSPIDRTLSIQAWYEPRRLTA